MNAKWTPLPRRAGVSVEHPMERMICHILGIEDVPDGDTQDYVVGVFGEDYNAVMREMLRGLHENQQLVLTLHYGLDDSFLMRGEDVAARLGVSRARMYQIEGKAFRLLRHPHRREQAKRRVRGEPEDDSGYGRSIYRRKMLDGGFMVDNPWGYLLERLYHVNFRAKRQRILSRVLGEGMEQLTELQRTCLERNCGTATGGRIETQKAIAKQLGISQFRVMASIEKAIDGLRNYDPLYELAASYYEDEPYKGMYSGYYFSESYQENRPHYGPLPPTTTANEGTP